MPKGPNGQKRPADSIGCAVSVARIATGEQEDTAFVTPNRRKSGLAGAKARNETLSAHERSRNAEAAAKARWNGMEVVMNQNVENATRELFATSERGTRDIKYFFQTGDNTAEQLADYRNRAVAQIESGMSAEDVELDGSILD